MKRQIRALRGVFPVVWEGMSWLRMAESMSLEMGAVVKCIGNNGLLTILTSDTISMLAMSMFIPTPTGGPGADQNNRNQVQPA